MTEAQRSDAYDDACDKVKRKTEKVKRAIAELERAQLTVQWFNAEQALQLARRSAVATGTPRGEPDGAPESHQNIQEKRETAEALEVYLRQNPPEPGTKSTMVERWLLAQIDEGLVTYCDVMVPGEVARCVKNLTKTAAKISRNRHHGLRIG